MLGKKHIQGGKETHTRWEGNTYTVGSKCIHAPQKTIEEADESKKIKIIKPKNKKQKDANNKSINLKKIIIIFINIKKCK